MAAIIANRCGQTLRLPSAAFGDSYGLLLILQILTAARTSRAAFFLGVHSLIKTKDETTIANRLLRLLARARDQELIRSEALKSLHVTADLLDKVAESLRTQRKIGVEMRMTRGRSAVVYTLPPEAKCSLPRELPRDERLEIIGRLVVEAVRLAGGAK
jgi:hypothetical protein